MNTTKKTTAKKAVKKTPAKKYVVTQIEKGLPNYVFDSIEEAENEVRDLIKGEGSYASEYDYYIAEVTHAATIGGIAFKKVS